MALSESLFGETPPRAPARLNLARHALWAGQPDDRTALTVLSPEGAASRSYGALREAVACAAGGFRGAGLEPGGRVMLRLGNSEDFPVLFLGAVAAGGVACPTAAALTPGEAARVRAALDPALLVSGPGLGLGTGPGRELAPEALRGGPALEPVDTAAEAPAFIVQTSGSSGAPKGVVHAHRSAWARRMMWRGWYGLTAEDVMLHAGAFNWTFTLGAGLLDPWGAGARAAIWAGPPDPTLWPRLAERSGATLFAAAPGVLRQTLKRAGRVREGFRGLRHALVAGEALAPSLAEAWTRETGKPVYEALGMSEISTYVSSSPETPPRPGFVGRPQPGRRVAALTPGTDRPAPLGETGELAVDRRDPGLMLGYWRDPEATAAAMRGDWFVTGDLAAMDAEGHVAWRGRADDLLNCGGFRLAPQEVEAALTAHPQVEEAGAYALAVGGGASVVAALVVGEAEPEALTAWCAERLAPWKRPRRIDRVAALPRTRAGKLDRRAMGRSGGG